MNKKQMSKRQRDIKSKLMAAVAMLLVSSIMMVSTTYAWFTLSTAPEVTGISTAVGANGNLEMALLPAEQKLDKLDDPAEGIKSAVGDSSSATTQTIDKANITWGNLVDVSDTTYYGMDKIQLYPAALNTNAAADTILANPLKTPVYGADGRVSALEAKTLTGIYNASNSAFEESAGATKYGVRAIGTASNLSNSELAYRSAKTTASNAASDAKTAASRSLSTNGNTLAAMAINKGTNGADSYPKEQVQALADVVTTLNTAVGQIETAMKQFILAESLAPATVTDDNYEAIVAAVTAEGVDVATLVSSTPANVVLPNGISAGSDAVTKLAEMKTNVSAAKSTMDALIAENKDTYVWDDFDSAINAVMSTTGLTLNEFTIPQLLEKDGAGNLKNVSAIMSAALNEGLKLQMGKDSGIYADIAEFCGNFTASITLQPFTVMSITTPELPATMMTTVTGTPYLSAIETSLSSFTGSDGATGAKPITTYYGYIIDLAFRTNAATSSLKLQTEGIDRVYSDNTANEATMGHGASMSFYSPNEATFKSTQVQSLMSAIRVIFFDPSSNKIIQEARLNPATAVTTEKTLADSSKVNEVTMDLVLWDTAANAPKSDAIIAPLDQNKALAVSALVYLDGERITNADVAATETMSMTGSMNLQFSSTAELKPMEYADLRSGTASSGSGETQPTITDVNSTVTDGYTATVVHVASSSGNALVAKVMQGGTEVTSGVTVKLDGATATYGGAGGHSGWMVAGVDTKPDTVAVTVEAAG